MTPAFLLRADGGGWMGAGHFVRSGALAEHLVRGGGAVSFFTAFDGDVSRFGLRSDVLERVTRFDSSADADRAFLEALKPGDGAIVDGYTMPPALLQAARNRGCRVVYITELLDEERAPFATDILFPGGDFYTTDYRSRFAAVMRDVRVWSSPADIPLREIVEQQRTDEDGHGLVMTLGGSDPRRLAPALLAHVVASMSFDAITVLAPHPDDASTLRNSGGGRLRVVPAPPIEQFLSEIARAAFVLTAAGSTCWELMRMARPFFPIVIADNQRELARGLVEHGIVPSYFDALEQAIEEIRIDVHRAKPSLPGGERSPLIADLLTTSVEATLC